jgi:hypothetical protein
MAKVGYYNDTRLQCWSVNTGIRPMGHVERMPALEWVILADGQLTIDSLGEFWP